MSNSGIPQSHCKNDVSLKFFGYKPGIDLSNPSRPSAKATGEMTNMADCKKTNGDEDSAASTLPVIRIEGVESSFD